MPRHQTLHKEIRNGVKNLRGHALVKQVVIGRYENCRHRYTPGSFKISRQTSNGLKLAGYDGSGIYDFYVYLKQPTATHITTITDYISRISK